MIDRIGNHVLAVGAALDERDGGVVRGRIAPEAVVVHWLWREALGERPGCSELRRVHLSEELHAVHHVEAVGDGGREACAVCEALVGHAHEHGA